MAIVGLIMMAQAFTSAIGALVGGVTYDARGARWPMLWAVGISACMMALLAVFHDVWVFSVAVMVIGSCMSATMPIFNALSVEVWPDGGRRAFNSVYVALNAGVAIGSSLGGLLAAASFRLAFSTAALVVAGIWGFIYFGYRSEHWTRAPRHKPHAIARLAPNGSLWRAAGWPILLMSLALVLQWTAYDQWETTVPNFMQAEHMPLILYSSLWTVNTVLILLAQPLLRRVLVHLPRIMSQLLVGSGLFVLAFFLLAESHAYTAYLIAMVLATLGEMLVLPGVPAIAEEMSPPSRRGLVQGVVTMGSAVGRMAGPMLGGFLFVASNPDPLFLVMTGLMVVGGLTYLVSQWSRDRWHDHGEASGF